MNVKDATHATVHDYPGGAESLAPRMSIKSPQVLRNKVNPTTDTHHLRLDEAVRMMAVTGDYRIIEAMAGELGGTFALLPTSQVTEQSLIAMLLNASNAHGNTCKVFSEALADGYLDHIERKDINQALDETIQTLYCIKQAMQVDTDHSNPFDTKK